MERITCHSQELGCFNGHRTQPNFGCLGKAEQNGTRHCSSEEVVQHWGAGSVHDDGRATRMGHIGFSRVAKKRKSKSRPQQKRIT